eukprot:NODE_1965_length_1022_cov_168.458376_g1597_i0.p1 GENE.NODE_1965_length_1022_cov_168.458376_g1597_i0~~NODE_1965_length_1022_cov_168.458376_g1597_i0.p1  ORF type:complete len:262 (-),score=28.18 NODE_1965_length_1022_cov_168.458376_g1597_i0:130-915(-)
MIKTMMGQSALPSSIRCCTGWAFFSRRLTSRSCLRRWTWTPVVRLRLENSSTTTTQYLHWRRCMARTHTHTRCTHTHTRCTHTAQRAEEKQMENLRSKTQFSSDEIKAMYANFKRIACAENDDGVIDKHEFRAMMMDSQLDAQRNTVFYDGLFRMFDRDGSGDIDFTEFVLALAVYHGKSQGHSVEDKARFLFSVYDVDGDGFISKDDLRKVLYDCLVSNDIAISQTDLANLVEATFQNMPSAASGRIDFEAFKRSKASQG